MVYIQEVHTLGGWQVQENIADGLVMNQPADLPARSLNARTCRARLRLTMPCVVDTMDNDVDALYAGFPERMFVIEGDGKVAYAGKMGPWGFKPEEAEAALAPLLDQWHAVNSVGAK